jgi:hypothetical protein
MALMYLVHSTHIQSAVLTAHNMEVEEEVEKKVEVDVEVWKSRRGRRRGGQ